MKTTIKSLLLMVAFYVGACGEPERTPAQAQTNEAQSESLFVAQSEQSWALPQRLSEISALAVGPNGRLFGVDDERAIIYELDAAQGGLVKSFAVGAPLSGDFEGLAITPAGEFWMTTSEGALFRFREGEDGARVEFVAFESGLADICEIEGLAYLPSEQSLILACKQNQARDMRDTIALYAWREGAPATLWRSLPERNISSAAGIEHFRPSSLDIDARTGRLLLLSASDAALAEIGADGSVIAARRLARVHTQAEGVAVLSDGALVIADEGGDGRALLSRYPRRP